ncbi:hypothetical protein E3N88_01388 [Mikania micrantha]|uniref:Uncharacterized protein n=1 Tax=Mikania micrantha TaxID=192012 RepID=A0A5N6Q127_9ASTR|nr:hypothetical protein E3N88_01388 [Mikania micrantha]
MTNHNTGLGGLDGDTSTKRQGNTTAKAPREVQDAAGGGAAAAGNTSRDRVRAMVRDKGKLRSRQEPHHTAADRRQMVTIQEDTTAMSSIRSVDSLLTTETLELDSGLSLVPRLKLNLTVHWSDASITPLDEWQLKASLIDFLKASFSIIVPDDDLHLRKFKDAKKRKREDPVAHDNLFIRELGFLSKKKVGEWKKMVVAKMDGIELSLVGG